VWGSYSLSLGNLEENKRNYAKCKVEYPYDIIFANGKKKKENKIQLLSSY